MGPVAEQFLTGAAAAGVTKLGTEITEIPTLGAAHGTGRLLTALQRAVAFGRWRAADVRSILATPTDTHRPTAAGHALVMTLPTVPTRSLEAYRIGSGASADAEVVREHDRDVPAAAAGGSERGPETVEDGRDAPAGTRAAPHLSAYDLTCRVGYDLTCRSRRG
ncbi:hypothetical protein J2S59_001430 [Nocardioides massiliensis]|uniref:Uncharacterized protein n=1 Tax=Nocardioides massiliensis TaxID=1325935 RepID=A0ABT9NMH6_9ACTN|nr:hypothetical protein [Nocardioides massiliensis]MDP9821621.1 hypothetical protein [Nocardioides massiliensis]